MLRLGPRAIVVALLLALGLVGGCGTDSAAPNPPTADTAEALKEKFVEMIALAKAKRREDLIRFVRSLLPTRAELRAIVREGADADAWLSAYAGPTVENAPADKGGEPDPAASQRTEIHVYAATTEEIAAYVKGSVAMMEFPGGMQRFAQRVAAPARTWYTVKAVEPGQASGTRYTCLTNVGGHFVLVAKPWRAIPRAASSSAEPDEPR